jgi:hypothetical protein
MDQNNDGIRDDIKALVEHETKASGQFTAAPSSVVKTELSSAIRDGKKMSAEPARRTCFDYLLLEPKERALANRHMQSNSQSLTELTPQPCGATRPGAWAADSRY